MVKKVFGCLFIASACFALTHALALLWAVNKSLTNSFIHGHRHLFVYLLTLLSIDFFVVITYPLEAYYRLKEDWPFDTLLCSFYKSVELFYLYCPPLICIFLWNDYYVMISSVKRSCLRTVGAAFVFCLLSVLIAVGLIVPTYLYSQLEEVQISAVISKTKCSYEDHLPRYVSWASFSASFTSTFLIPLCSFTCYAILTENQRSRSHYRRSYRPHRKWLIAYSVFIFISRSFYWVSFAAQPLVGILDSFTVFILVNVLRFILSPLSVCADPFFSLILACNIQNF